MLKVAVLDDYQNIFSQIINLDEYKSKYEFTIFNEPFQNELEATEAVSYTHLTLPTIYSV